MRRSRWLTPALSILTLLAAAPAAADPKDSPACAGKEHPLFTRMPGWILSKCDEKAFGQHRFAVVGADGRRADQVVEGHFYEYYYRWGGDGPKPSGVQIARNYASAATSGGGEVTFTGNRGSVVRFTKGGKRVWAAAQEGGSGLNLVVVEVEGMKQEVTADAEALRGGLAANGHVELTGIYFDTGKSELKPESGPALAEVEKLLKADPRLAVWIVGHTDNVGGVDANLTLSRSRAGSVVSALVEKHGIEAKRLAPYGAGPYAPVASNATEDGRARNRRVEIVVQ